MSGRADSFSPAHNAGAAPPPVPRREPLAPMAARPPAPLARPPGARAAGARAPSDVPLPPQAPPPGPAIPEGRSPGAAQPRPPAESPGRRKALAPDPEEEHLELSMNQPRGGPHPNPVPTSSKEEDGDGCDELTTVLARWRRRADGHNEGAAPQPVPSGEQLAPMAAGATAPWTRAAEARTARARAPSHVPLWDQAPAIPERCYSGAAQQRTPVAGQLEESDGDDYERPIQGAAPPPVPSGEPLAPMTARARDPSYEYLPPLAPPPGPVIPEGRSPGASQQRLNAGTPVAGQLIMNYDNYEFDDDEFDAGDYENRIQMIPRRSSAPPPRSVSPQSDRGSTESIYVTEVLIRRPFIVQDMMTTFGDLDLESEAIVVKFAGEKGIDADGLTRDALSAFWHEVFAMYFDGERDVVPLVHPQLGPDEYETMGKILVYGFGHQGYFPLQFSLPCLASALGLTALPSEVLLQGLIGILGREEGYVVKNALERPTFDEETTDTLLEVFGRYGITRSITPANLKDVALQCATTLLTQKPFFALKAMKLEVLKTFEEFQTLESIQTFYQSLRPTGRKVASCLQADDENLTSTKRRVFDFLTRAIRAMDEELLMRLLRFTTGSDSLVVDRIGVQFTQLSGLQRCIVAHTCTATLDVPVGYASYREFRNELLSQLNAGQWEINFA